MRVLILCGGESSERYVSLASGWAVARALLEQGMAVVLVDPAAVQPILAEPKCPEDVPGVLEVGKEPPSHADRQLLRRRMYAALTGGPVLELLRGADMVFLALHGGWGEDGHVQALLEMAEVRFTGAGSAACAAAWHKARAQAVLSAAGIPVAERALWLPGSGELPHDVARLIEMGPTVAKPVADGSSVSVHYVNSQAQLRRIEAEMESAVEMLLEPYMPGREFTVGVIGGQALPVVEIELATPVFDYEAKYQPGAVNEVCPARIPDDLTLRLQYLARTAHQALGFGSSSYSRADFRCDANQEPMCLEVNALPGLTSTSLLPLAASKNGWSYPTLISRILDLAIV